MTELSLAKLFLGPNKKLLVLSLGGLLVHRVNRNNKHTVRGLKPDVVSKKYLVFKRPFCAEFLDFCFDRFDVALWSAAKEDNVEDVLTVLTGSTSKFLFVWDQEKCIRSGLSEGYKPLFLKNMNHLWRNKYYKGQYSANNTLLIDDKPYTALLNPPNTAIFPKSYEKHNKPDTYLGPDGELRKYLDGLVEAKDVPSYVKDHPFGQPAITPTHPDWDYYAEIMTRFRKN